MDDYLSKKIKILSLFAIVMVIYVHAYNLGDRYLLPWSPLAEPLGVNSFVQYFVSNGLTRFAVPLFFTISGFLFFRNLTPDPAGFAEKFGKRLRTLMIPYVLWSAGGLAWAWGLQQSEILRPAVDSWDIRAQPATFDWLLYRLVANPVPFQLWFLRDLILYAALSPLIYLALRYLSFAALLPLFIVWFLHGNLVIMEAEGILFFTLGAWLTIQDIAPPRKSAGALSSALTIALIMLWMILLVVKTRCAYADNLYATPAYLIPLHKLAILCGFFSVWFGYDLLGERLNASKFLMSLAPFTFFIYAAHEPLLNCLSNYALFQAGVTPETQLTIFLLTPVATLTVCLFSAAALRQFARPIFSLLTGGR